MKCIEMGENKFMQKKALLALLLVLTMILSGCSLIVKDEAVDAARVVIRVGDDTYTKAQVQAQIQNQVNYMTALYSRYGLSFDSTNADVMNSLTDNVLNSLVERSVLLAKAKELGLDQLTDEEKTKIEENTASQLDSLRKSAANEFSLDLETQLEEINAKLDELGYTEEVVRKGMTESLLITKAEDYAVKDVTVTEDEIVADFNSKVEAAKTSYESDLSAYGKAVLNGTTVHYRPAGYRNVKQILIKYSDEDSALVSNIQTALDNVITEQNNAANVMAKLGGFDIAGLCGIFLGGALERVPVLADGFISGVAALCAVRLCPAAEKAVFASHCSTEPAAKLVLDALNKKALITAGLHLGEGTGAVAAIPLWDMALAVYRDCYSFTEGGITPYTPQC